MKHKSNFRKNHLDKKIKISSRIMNTLILVMFGIVIHDSYIHVLPFHHILYTVAGIFVGHLLAFSQKVVVADEQQKLRLEVHPIGKILTVLLLVVRFFAGELILEEFNAIWITDAIYLFFIGIYLSKVKNINYQIDDKMYAFFMKNKDKQ